MFTPRIVAVNALATTLHEGQTRKCYGGVELPYIAHPQAVMALALTSARMTLYRDDFREHIAVAALLHDVLEDTGISSMDLARELANLNFSASETADILDTVRRLTRVKGQDIIEYLDQIRLSLAAVIVKRADLEDNLRDSPEGSKRDKYVLCMNYLSGEVTSMPSSSLV